LTYRNYPDQPAYTEIAINAGMSIRYPEVWMMPPGAEHNDEWSWVAGFMPPDGADWNNEYLQDWNKCIEEWPHYATFPPEQDNCGNVNNMGEPMAPQFCYHDAGGTPMCDPGPAETHCSTLSAVYNCLTVHETNPEFGFLGPLCSSMGPEQAFWDSFNPVMNADNDVNVGCKEQRRVYMLTDNLEPLTNDRVASVVWDGHGVMDYKHCVTDTFFEYIDYDMESRMWEHIRFSPQSKSNYGPEFRYTSPDAPVVGMNKIIVTYDTNQTLEINVDVDNVDPMPIVDSKTKYVAQKDDKSKSGKAVKVLENQVVKNITTRFLDNGALVIQWPEPDGALMGGMQLRLFIGNDTINPVTGCNDEDFLWINSPAQIGTIVITSDIWEPFVLKTLGRDPEATSIVAVFMYRDTYNQDGGVAYHNRGYSGEFYIPLTP
jgi:hypothetical protein